MQVADDLNLSSSPRDLTRLDANDEQIDIGTNLDYRSTSPHIDLNNFNTDNDDAVAMGFGAGSLNKPLEIPESKNMMSTRMDSIGVDSQYNEMSYQDNPFDDSLRKTSENLPKEEAGQFTKQHGSKKKSTSKDGSNHGSMSIADKSAKPKLKRSSGNENSTTKPESAKKAKVDIASLGATGSFSEHKKNLPLEKHNNDRSNKETGSVSRDASRDSSPAMKGRPSAFGISQKIDQSPNVPIPTMHSERTKENIEKSNSKKKTDKMQKPWHGVDGDVETGYSHGEGHHVNFDGSDDSAARKRSRHGDPLIDDKMLKRSKDANVNVNPVTKTSRGNVGPDEVTAFPESNESNGEPSNSQRDNVERSPHGKKKLQRELSDLELGELRETCLENDNGRTRKQFERNSSSKSLDGKLTNVNNSFPSMNNRKAPLTAFHNKRKPSPQEYGIGGHVNQEGFPRKAAGYDLDDNRPQPRGNVPESQHLPRTDNSDSENILYPDRSGEKTGKREARMAHGGMLEYADMKKKTTSRLPQNGSNNVTVSRTQKSISPLDNEERSRNNSLIETETGRKRRDSSSDEDNLFFSKYDKDEPELKGPIKDFSQYKDYVQEYNEKYEVYSYLSNQLEKTKSEFLKVEEDLNVAKERDKEQYYNILERLRDMFRESVSRHKLMKKVFVLLHEELQTIKQRIRDFSEAYSNE
uniref:OCEL domain-containing protein n=1 Tax=Arundo donax TaxID=35708 RepID=A0A0A9CHZ2_ARUDO